MAARKSRGNSTVTFNSVALTNYCNQNDLDMTVDRIETTHLGSSGAESIAGDTEYTISVGGDWDTALDTALAPEAITTGTKRTAAVLSGVTKRCHSRSGGTSLHTCSGVNPSCASWRNAVCHPCDVRCNHNRNCAISQA